MGWLKSVLTSQDIQALGTYLQSLGGASPTPTPVSGTPTPTPVAPSLSGGELFSKYCTSCHGSGALAQGVRGKNAGDVSDALSEVGSMGWLKSVLSSQDIQALGSYLQSLGAQPTPTPIGPTPTPIPVTPTPVVPVSGGAALFGKYCAACHDPRSAGFIGETVDGKDASETDEAISEVGSMRWLRSQLSPSDIEELGNYLEGLEGDVRRDKDESTQSPGLTDGDPLETPGDGVLEDETGVPSLSEETDVDDEGNAGGGDSDGYAESAVVEPRSGGGAPESYSRSEPTGAVSSQVYNEPSDSGPEEGAGLALAEAVAEANEPSSGEVMETDIVFTNEEAEAYEDVGSGGSIAVDESESPLTDQDPVSGDDDTASTSADGGGFQFNLGAVIAGSFGAIFEAVKHVASMQWFFHLFG